MTAAYLDPFAQIVGLNKPANKSAILITEFGPGAYTEGLFTPPPGYVAAFRARWDGDVRIYLVPKFSTLSTSQIVRVLQGLLYYPSFPGQPDPPHGWIGNPATGAGAGTLSYFATPELAMEHSLMTGAGSVIRGPSVAACVKTVEKLELSLGATARDNISLSNGPFYEDLAGQVSGYTFSWGSDGFTVCTVTPPALDGIKARSLFGANGFIANAEAQSLILANSYTEIDYAAGFPNYPAHLVTGTTAVPAAVTGQSQFNSQRTANLAYVGSVTYP